MRKEKVVSVKKILKKYLETGNVKDLENSLFKSYLRGESLTSLNKVFHYFNRGLPDLVTAEKGCNDYFEVEKSFYLSVYNDLMERFDKDDNSMIKKHNNHLHQLVELIEIATSLEGRTGSTEKERKLINRIESYQYNKSIND